MDPVIWFFLLGLTAGLLRSDLRLPPAIYELLSMLLLLTIGLKGGVELAQQPLAGVLPQMAAVIAMGITLPLLLFPVLLYIGRFKRPDAASIAAHYGSVSVATYAVAVAYLGSKEVSFEAHMPLFVVLLEMPGLIVGILLARGLSSGMRWGALAHEIFLGKSMVLLLGGLLIGWATGPEAMAPLEPLFFDLFKGVLALFLLEMGLIAASQAQSLRRYGPFLVAFGLIVPIPLAAAGTALGWAIGLSPGGSMLLGVLAGSCSYIAAPAAMRIAVPQANPTLSLTISLGITFPFNIFFGIPLYHLMANTIHG
ncbi:sodium-dependent bicarbonate transport family permease [Lentisalinibacter salinarum]|uniref:sodium-dependent bicarbonate transport family permease n=1 Tax=Lentisalinibacter salinarum TaxID=2992239 RepID=UPI0038697061